MRQLRNVLYANGVKFPQNRRHTTGICKLSNFRTLSGGSPAKYPYTNFRQGPSLLQSKQSCPFLLKDFLYSITEPDTVNDIYKYHRISHQPFSTISKSKNIPENKIETDNFLDLVENSNKFFDFSIHPEGSLLMLDGNNEIARDHMIQLIFQWNDNMKAIQKLKPALNHRLKKMQYHGADLCDSLLKRLIVESKRNRNAFLDVTPFVKTIECLQISGRTDAGQRSWKILGSWNGLFGGDLDLAPDTKSFHTVLEVYKSCAKKPSDANDASKILDLMHELRKGGNLYVDPDNQSIEIVLETWQNVVKSSKSVDEAQLVLSNATKLFKRITQSHENQRDISWNAYATYLRTNIGFIQVVHRMMNANENNITSEKWNMKMDEIELKSDQLFSDMNELPLPSQKSHEELEEIFLGLIQSFSNHVYNSLHEGYTSKTLERIKRILEWMLHRYENDKVPTNALVGVRHYHAILNFCARYGTDGNSKRKYQILNFGHEILDEVDTKYISFVEAKDIEHKKLLGEMFVACIKVFSRNDDEQTSESLLLRMMKYIYEEKVTIAPKNIISSINEVLICWSRCHMNKTNSAVKSIENLLQQFMNDDAKRFGIKPTSASFNAAIRTFARAGEERKALEYLKLMEDLATDQKNQTKLDQNNDDDALFIRPNIIAYTYVLEQMNNADSALALWERIKNQCNTHNHPSMQPDANAYRAVVDALIRSKRKGIARHAEFFLYEMLEENVVPNKYIFTSVINAWGKEKNNPKAADHVLNLLNKMLDIGIEPDTISYTAILKSLANGTRINKDSMYLQYAMQILKKMENEYYEQKNTSLKPNKLTYTEVIKVLSNHAVQSSKFEKLQHAVRILQEMISSEDVSIHPSNYTFRVLLNSCCEFPTKSPMNQGNNSHEDSKALSRHLAIRIMRIYREEASQMMLQPDELLYGTMFKSYAQLVSNSLNDDDNEIQNFMNKEIENCCVDGRVNHYVWDQIQNKVHDLSFSESIADFNDIPYEWKRNIGKKRINKRKKRQKY